MTLDEAEEGNVLVCEVEGGGGEGQGDEEEFVGHGGWELDMFDSGWQWRAGFDRASGDGIVSKLIGGL